MESRSEQTQDGISMVLELAHARAVAGSEEGLPVTLTLRSHGPQPRRFTFPSSQEYDFTVSDGSGTARWRWSDGRYFAMRTAARTLGTEPWIYEETIPLVDSQGRPLPPGEYLLRARLVATPALTHQITFEIR